MVHIPNTPIIVDEFKFIPGAYVYLLTHLHTDHTGGLSPSWNYGTIYCSHLSKAMLLHKFKLNPALVVSLDEDDTHSIPLDPSGKVTMQLTLIDANHCPGACMFLLQGYFGTILHTGDFRFDPLILEHHAIRNKSIDHLYLDDTFLDPQYEFPSRKIAGSDILNIVTKYSDNTKFLIGVDTLGKEELLVALGVALKSLVVVDAERLESIAVMRQFVNIPDIFTDRQNEGRVIVVSKREVNIRRIQEMRQTSPTIGICASGWSTKAVQEYKKYRDPWIHRVAYSLHSSYSELVQFVSALKPKQIYSGSKHDNLQIRGILGQYCNPDSNISVEIPRSVKVAMESKKFTKAIAHRETPPKKQKRSSLKAKGLRITAKRDVEKIDLCTQTVSSDGEDDVCFVELIPSPADSNTESSGINNLLEVMSDNDLEIGPIEASQETLSLLANLGTSITSACEDSNQIPIDVEQFEDVFSYSTRNKLESYKSLSTSINQLIEVKKEKGNNISSAEEVSLIQIDDFNSPPRKQTASNQKKRKLMESPAITPVTKKSKVIDDRTLFDITSTLDLMNVPLSLDGFETFADPMKFEDPAEKLMLSPIKRVSPAHRRVPETIQLIDSVCSDSGNLSLQEEIEQRASQKSNKNKPSYTDTISLPASSSLEIIDLTKNSKKRKTTLPFALPSQKPNLLVTKILSQFDADCIIID